MSDNQELLDGPRLRALLRELADRLALRGVRASIYVVGGAAMALVFNERRATRDIDSVILEGHGPLTEEVRAMGRKHGLPGSWLNDQAQMYVSALPDPAGAMVFDHANLTVTTASARRLLAMKLMAARASDVQDIALLIGLVGVSTIAEAETVLHQAFPNETLSRRATLIVEDLLA